MRDFFINLFSSDNGKAEIAFLSLWHIVYAILIVGLTALVAYLINNKPKEVKEKVLKIYAIAALCVYIADFFIMPLYMDVIDIDKLPFHICTLLCPFIILTTFSNKFNVIKTPVAVLSLVAAMMYITYPGSAIGGVKAFSYRVIQTFVYHGLVFGFGFLSISTKTVLLEFKKIYKEVIFLACIAVWASFGNAVYSNSEHTFDWFFINGPTFSFVPKFLLPFAVIGCIYALVIIIYLLQKLFEKKIFKNLKK